MKKLAPGALMFLLLAMPFISNGQVYTTTAGEMIFSFNETTQNGQTLSSPMRWSPVFNFGTHAHYDAGKSVGFFSGLIIKNIGFIYQDANNLKVIQRSYNLGIPIAIKLGKLDNFFVYGGYQFELPFHYKYKSWDSSDRGGAKTKFTQFFSDGTPSTMHTVFAGIQFYKGLNLKFHWYLDNFVNPDYERNGVRVNDGLEVQVFSFSLAANMFRGTQLFYSE